MSRSLPWRWWHGPSGPNTATPSGAAGRGGQNRWGSEARLPRAATAEQRLEVRRRGFDDVMDEFFVALCRQESMARTGTWSAMARLVTAQTWRATWAPFNRRTATPGWREEPRASMGTKATPEPRGDEALSGWVLVRLDCIHRAEPGLGARRLNHELARAREGADTDPALRGQEREVNRPLRRQRVPARQYDPEGIRQEVPVDEIVVRDGSGRHRLHCHEDVDLAAAQAGDRCVALDDDEVKVHFRVKCLEGGESPGHERGAGCGERAEPYAAAVAGGQRSEGVLGVPYRREHSGRVLAEKQRGIRRSHAPAHPLEEPDTCLALQRAHLLAHCGGGVAEELCRSRYRAGLHDGLKSPQASDVDHITIKAYLMVVYN